MKILSTLTFLRDIEYMEDVHSIKYATVITTITDEGNHGRLQFAVISDPTVDQQFAEANEYIDQYLNVDAATVDSWTEDEDYEYEWKYYAAVDFVSGYFQTSMALNDLVLAVDCWVAERESTGVKDCEMVEDLLPYIQSIVGDQNPGRVDLIHVDGIDQSLLVDVGRD